ncbi:helix-turn-helix domain-containing protein [Sphingomonas morindae]|uniref:Helix-turn-helix domain-containing protein n=1 Tax=Sphingomonas morindae TaxID=1541170 RepID=A0ABY4XAK8_9SPHN|nr:helix-turn-helix transcriptional regulator [Sphingomonas morindae]USI73934.1 helix-turn-helix domain-containing protein [Sphingomonas morindae]
MGEIDPGAETQVVTTTGQAQKELHAAVGRRIRAVRKSRSISQVDCAKGAGIDVSSMFRIEKTGQNLTIDTLARLAISLDVPMEKLIADIELDPRLVEPRQRS